MSFKSRKDWKVEYIVLGTLIYFVFVSDEQFFK